MRRFGGQLVKPWLRSTKTRGRGYHVPHNVVHVARKQKPYVDGQPQEKRRSPQGKRGFLLRLFPRERRYAELGYLLPFPIGPTVKTRCIGSSSWLASYG